MKKKFAAFVLCVICLLSAAGCGQTKTDEQTPPAADQSTTTDDYLTTISGTYVELFPELSKSEYLTIMRGIVCVPIAGVVAAFTALDADELAGAGEGGEAQLRQSIRQLGGEQFLFRLDAPLVRIPKVDIQLTSAIHKDIPLLKALAPAVRCLSGEVFL